MTGYPISTKSIITTLFAKIFAFLAGYLGVKASVRLAAIATLAAIYLACLATFVALIVPLFNAIIATSYGFLLGLLFPPVAGTVTAGLMLYRTCVIGVRYTSRFLKIAAGI